MTARKIRGFAPDPPYLGPFDPDWRKLWDQIRVVPNPPPCEIVGTPSAKPNTLDNLATNKGEPTP